MEDHYPPRYLASGRFNSVIWCKVCFALIGIGTSCRNSLSLVFIHNMLTLADGEERVT